MSFILSLLMVQAPMEAERYDHTQDVAVVASFLAGVRSGEAGSDAIAVTNRDDPRNSTIATFAKYANECEIDKIYAIPSATRPLPISVEWDCGRHQKIDGKLVWEERSAGFWVEDGRIVRLNFGKRPTMTISAPRIEPNG